MTAEHAIQVALTQAPRGIYWRPDIAQWETYSLTAGCPEGCEPEFAVLSRAMLPLPLSETASQVLSSLIQSKQRGK